MKLKESWYLDIQDKLEKYFYDTYFLSLIELFQEPLYNSANDVINAIRRGQIVLQGDEITGVFNIKVSKELSKFAKFNKYTHKWKIADKTIIPKDILASSVVANEKAKQLQERMKSIIDNTANVSKDKIKDTNFDISKQAKEMDTILEKERIDLGIEYEMNDQIREEMTKVYNENMQLNIKNWDSDQIMRLRDMIERSALEGYNRTKMIEAIETEYEVSKSKATFLARNETSQFMSNLTNERFMDAGVRWYLWSNSHDVRVVGNPAGKYPKPSEGHGNHWVMQNKVCRFDNPKLYADSVDDAKKNLWKNKSDIGADNRHAGESYNCRCAKRAVIL
jgi:uncharacterized protein with gpF-like domain